MGHYRIVFQFFILKYISLDAYVEMDNIAIFIFFNLACFLFLWPQLNILIGVLMCMCRHLPLAHDSLGRF